MRRTVSLWLGLAALAVMPVLTHAQVPTGKIHGQVINPTGAPQTTGTVTAQLITRAASGPGLKPQTEDKGVFQVDANGNFGGDVPAGVYNLIFRQPDTPPDKEVDRMENVHVTVGQTTEQNIDMSRQEFVDKLPADQKQKLEDLRKKNSEALKSNEVIKHLNADLQQVNSDLRAADNAATDAEQQLGAGASKQDKEAKANDIRTAKYTEAEQLMTKDTQAKPDAAVLWAQLGQAELGLKKFPEAEAAFKKALEVNAASKKPDPGTEGTAQSGLGATYARQSKTDDAVAAFDAAAKANPPSAATYLKNEAVIFFQQNLADAQVAAADKAIAASGDPNNPKNAVLYYLKGNGLVQKTTMDDKTHKLVPPPGCMEAYQKYLQLDPTGTYATEVKGILDGFNQTIDTSYKAPKKK